MDLDVILGSAGVVAAVFAVAWLYWRSSVTIELIRRRRLHSLREIRRVLRHGE